MRSKGDSALKKTEVGRGVEHPPPSSAEVEARVQLYICSPSGRSWPVLGRTLPLPLPFCLFLSFFCRFFLFGGKICNVVKESNIKHDGLEKVRVMVVCL